MIRRWLNANANASARNRQKETTGNTRFGQFEHLEEKRCLAFVGFFDGVTLRLGTDTLIMEMLSSTTAESVVPFASQTTQGH